VLAKEGERNLFGGGLGIVLSKTNMFGHVTLQLLLLPLVVLPLVVLPLVWSLWFSAVLSNDLLMLVIAFWPALDQLETSQPFL
jgi:hypothetical protein